MFVRRCGKQKSDLASEKNITVCNSEAAVNGWDNDTDEKEAIDEVDEDDGDEADDDSNDDEEDADGAGDDGDDDDSDDDGVKGDGVIKFREVGGDAETDVVRNNGDDKSGDKEGDSE